MCCFSVCVYLCCVYVCMLCLMLCVCCILRVCVVVPGETGVVTAGMRSSAVARARPGTPAQGRHQSSHTSMYNWWWKSLLCRWRVDIEYPTCVLRLRVSTVHYFSKVLTMQSMIGVINQSRKLPAAAARCWVPGPLRAAIHFCSGKKPITWNIFRHGFSR